MRGVKQCEEPTSRMKKHRYSSELRGDVSRGRLARRSNA